MMDNKLSFMPIVTKNINNAIPKTISGISIGKKIKAL